jgi:hypothetical protein
MPEKSDAFIEWRQCASAVISGCVKNLPFLERIYRKTPSLSLRLRVRLRPRGEEKKRKCVSTLFPLAAVGRTEEEIEWKYVSTSKISILNKLGI